MGANAEGRRSCEACVRAKKGHCGTGLSIKGCLRRLANMHGTSAGGDKDAAGPAKAHTDKVSELQPQSKNIPQNRKLGVAAQLKVLSQRSHEQGGKQKQPPAAAAAAAVSSKLGTRPSKSSTGRDEAKSRAENGSKSGKKGRSSAQTIDPEKTLTIVRPAASKQGSRDRKRERDNDDDSQVTATSPRTGNKGGASEFSAAAVYAAKTATAGAWPAIGGDDNAAGRSPWRRLRKVEGTAPGRAAADDAVYADLLDDDAKIGESPKAAATAKTAPAGKPKGR